MTQGNRCADGAVAEVMTEGRIKSIGRSYRQNYVVFLRARDGNIAYIREFFDPIRAAWALDAPILYPNPNRWRRAIIPERSAFKSDSSKPPKLG